MPTATAQDWNALNNIWQEPKRGIGMSGGMEEMAALQRQEAGDHYRKMKIQPIEYIMANDLDYLSGNIINTPVATSQRAGLEDVRKIIHYCQFILESQYGVSE